MSNVVYPEADPRNPGEFDFSMTARGDLVQMQRLLEIAHRNGLTAVLRLGMSARNESPVMLTVSATPEMFGDASNALGAMQQFAQAANTKR